MFWSTVFESAQIFELLCIAPVITYSCYVTLCWCTFKSKMTAEELEVVVYVTQCNSNLGKPTDIISCLVLIMSKITSKAWAFNNTGFLCLTSAFLSHQLERTCFHLTRFDVWMKIAGLGKIEIHVPAPLSHSLFLFLTTPLCLAASDQLSAWLHSPSLPLCPSDQCCSQPEKEDVWKAHAEIATPGNASQRMTETREVCLHMCAWLCVCVCSWSLCGKLRVFMCVWVTCHSTSSTFLPIWFSTLE